MRVTNRWLGYCAPQMRDRLVDVVLTLDSHATLTLSSSAEGLRDDAVRTPGSHVVVGGTTGDVSGVNLAAAIVADGTALDVTLVVEHASGSLKSRAATAGISDVVDLSQFSVAARPWLGTVQAAGSPGDGRGWAAGKDAGALGEGDVRARASRRAGAPDDPPHQNAPSGWPPADRGRSVQSQGQAMADDRTTVLGAGGPDECTTVLGAARDAAHAPEPTVPQTPGLAAAPEHAEQGSSRVPTRGHADPQGPSPRWEGDAVRPRMPVVPDASAPRGGAPVIVYVSGRGGVGKTALCAASACVAASWGMRVALCDLDLSCGNLYSCFGLPRPVDLSVLGGDSAGDSSQVRERITRLGVGCADGIRLWGCCGRPEMAEVVWPLVGDIVDVLSGLCDLVVVDTSTTFTDAVAQAAQLCDRLVITVDGGSGSSVAQARLGALAVRLGVARTRIVRMVNHADPKGRDTTMINRAEVGLETAPSLRVVEGGDEVGEFMAAGQAKALCDAPGAFRDSVAHSTARLLSEMGRLPECEAAHRALVERRRKWRFGRRREAV
ncbi:MAG: hypothetical protein ACI4B6_05850 [Atopobiaceae bacterium]